MNTMNTNWINDIFFEVSFDAGLKLYYKLFNNDLTYRWIDLVKKCNDKDLKINSTHTKLYSKKEIDDLFQEFLDVIDLINTFIDIKLPDIKNLNYLKENKYLLNDLHEQFEVYGHIANSAMLRFNELIHIFEVIFDDRPRFFSCVNTNYIEFNNSKLKLEDYFLFTSDYEWGYIYLGYNTLGKPWHTISEDNDIEIIKRNQVKPQKTFSSEFYIIFNDTKPHTKKNIFYNWWIKNEFSKIYNETFTIENFAFGNIPLGHALYYTLNDEVIYDMSSINTPEARLEWSKNIWSKQNFTTKIQFVKAFTDV